MLVTEENWKEYWVYNGKHTIRYTGPKLWYHIPRNNYLEVYGPKLEYFESMIQITFFNNLCTNKSTHLNVYLFTLAEIFPENKNLTKNLEGKEAVRKVCNSRTVNLEKVKRGNNFILMVNQNTSKRVNSCVVTHFMDQRWFATSPQNIQVLVEACSCHTQLHSID